MFCSECGKKAIGKFCWNCGTPLVQGPSETDASPQALQVNNFDNSGPPVLSDEWIDWSDEVRYDALLQHPEVRQLIVDHASKVVERVSGEQFLELCDDALKPLVGGVPLSKVAAIAQPLYASWGIETGKSRAETIASPIGKVLVGVLCSLARNAQSIKRVEQGADGCVIEAELPSDLWALKGSLMITVERAPAGTKVDAATRIAGQLVDWGKSRRALQTLFDDTSAVARAA